METSFHPYLVGPAQLSERTKKAIIAGLRVQLPDYFTQLHQDIDQLFGQLYLGYEDNYRSIIFNGSVTSAVESMLQTYAPVQHQTLVLSNGADGERLAAILKRQGKSFVNVKSKWDQPLDLLSAEHHLRTNKNISHVCASHIDSATGMLNDIDSLNHLCRNYNKKLLLDASFSFGTEYLDLEFWNLAAFTGASEFSIMGPSGLGLVFSAISELEQEQNNSTCFSLDTQFLLQGITHGSHNFNCPLHLLAGLREAIREHLNLGGWVQANERQLEASSRLRNSMLAYGIHTYLDAQDLSTCITAFKLPKGWLFKQLHNRLIKHNVYVSPGIGSLYHSVFRVGVFNNFDDNMLQQFLSLFAQTIRRTQVSETV